MTGKIAKGVLDVKWKYVSSIEYTAENKGAKDVTLVIEHAGSWDLTDTPEPIEQTESLRRFKLDLPAGKTRKLRVKEQTTAGRNIQLATAEEKEYAYCSTSGVIPPAVREAIAKLIRLRAGIAESQSEIEQRRKQIEEITAEQTRIRENMKSVNQQQSEYYARLLKKLNDQESQIETLQSESVEWRKTAGARRKELDEYLSTLSVE